MRRLIFGSVLTLTALAATAAVVLASHSNGKGPKQDFATGTGHRFASGPPLPPGVESRTIMHVNARSVPGGGEEARGRFFVKREASAVVPSRPDLNFSGRVTCMTVVGNRAVVGGVITRDKLGPAVHPLSPLEGRGYLGVYIDNDQVNGGHDRSNSFPLPAPPGRDCPPFTDPTGEFQTGNFIVHDASP